MNCPTCSRRPSERWAPASNTLTGHCDDPCHDVADHAAKALQRIVTALTHNTPPADATEHALNIARATLGWTA